MRQPSLLFQRRQPLPQLVRWLKKHQYLVSDRYASLLGGVLLLVLLFRLWHLSAVTDNYDEGVYLASLRAMRAGYSLFTPIFSSQPPFFLWSLYPFVWLFGPTFPGARAGVVCFSLLGILAIYLLARRLGGPWVGSAAAFLLACDHFYLIQSQTLQADGPSVALMIVAVAAAATIQRWPWQAALISGVATALAILEKLFAVVAIVPIVLLFLSHLIAFERTQKSNDPSNHPQASHTGRGVALQLRLPQRQTRTHAGILASAYLLGGTLTTFLIFLPYLGQLHTAYQQIIAFHLAASQSFASTLNQNLQIILISSVSEYPLALLAFSGLVIGLLRRRWHVLTAGIWTLASLVLLLRQEPLFSHHLVLFVPGLVLTAALGLMPSPETIQAELSALQRTLHRLHLPPGALKTLVAALPVLLVVGVLSLNLRTNLNHPPGMPPTEATQLLQVANDLRMFTSSQQTVITDDQYIAMLANRNVPPEAVDTSAVRITTGYLTTDQVIAIARQPQVGAVLFYSGRFDHLPGLRAWVQQHFHLARTYGKGQALYVQRSP